MKEIRWTARRPRRASGPSRVVAAAASVLLAASFGTTALLALTGSSAGAAPKAAVPTTVTLHRLGTVNLSQIAGADAANPAAARTYGPHRVTPLGLLHQATAAASRSASPYGAPPAGAVDTIGGNVAGEAGLDGVTAALNQSANSPTEGSGGDVSPPDQGLGVGPSPAGTALVELVNDTLAIYSTKGATLLGPIPAFQVFDQPPATFLSDPRVYWDPSSQHWIMTMFSVGNSGGTVGTYGCSNGASPQNGCLSAEYIAVSTTTNPLGDYEAFWFDTSDSTNSANGCPCYGDYDQVGADGAGFYISTNEFPLNSQSNSGDTGFNGAVLYAMSKSGLISAADGGALPALQRYVEPDTTAQGEGAADPYAGYHLSPSTVTQGSAAPDTEYFVEANANLPNSAIANGLEVFALLGTSALNSGGRPTLAMTTVTTEPYSELPPNAVQEGGPLPLGSSYKNFEAPGIETDFNAVQEVTYASGLLYAELDTGFVLGQVENSGAAWFVLRPSAGSSTVSAADAANGYVETSQDILYPVIAVNSTGQGYMAFAIAGAHMFPSAAYVTFNGTHGPGSVVHVAAAGTDPLDDFTCYVNLFGYGPDCRYGDYSMAQSYGGNIYMATEYIGHGIRDVLSNWGTRVYWAPDQGYYLASSDGNVGATGNATPLAGTSVSGTKSITGIASTPDGEGYWLVGHDGSVTAMGDAKWLGDLPSMGTNVSNIVAIAPTADGGGYWLVGSDGGIFAFGDAHYVGSIPGIGKHVTDIVGMFATSNGKGYGMVGADGGVFAFGNTHFVGSLPGLGIHVNDIRAINPSPNDGGYVLVGGDGGTFVFGGGASFVGSLPGEGIHVNDIVGLALTLDGHGYWLAGSNGTVYPLGDAQDLPVPSSVSSHLPVVAIAGT